MNLVDRAKNIIVSPKTEWPAISAEEPNTSQVMIGYVLPMALLPAIAEIIGRGVIGTGMIRSFSWGIAMGLVQFVSAFIVVYLTAIVINALAGSFSSEKNMGRAIQLVAYSYTPAWVGGILNIIPAIGWIGGLFGLYGIYLMYLGLPHMMKTPQDKSVTYLIVSIVVLIIIYLIIAAILTAIFISIFGISLLGLRSMG